MSSTLKQLRLRRADVCSGCFASLEVGAEAIWDRAARTATCLGCAVAAAAEPRPEIELSAPGASLEREYARRVAARDKRVRERHPRIGGLLLALSDEPASTRVFAQGAEGERRLAAKLENGCDDVLFLHNRRLGPGARSGDIDHLAVAPSGVWVIDAKHYPGAKVDVEVSGGFFGRPRVERLVVRGRDRTSLVTGLARQHQAVGAALASYDVPVRAMFCFIGAELPWLRVPEIQGYAVRGVSDTRKQLRVGGPVDADVRQEIWKTLARAFASA